MGIGLRNRIFVLSFAVITLAVFAVSFTFVTFFRYERENLIDQELQLLASSLLASRIDSTELEQVGDLVADALGEDRIQTIVSLYSPTGVLLFRNDNGELLFARKPLPIEPERYSFVKGPHYLRFLNLRLLPSRLQLQVGFLLDKGEIRWGGMTHIVLKYIAGIFVFLLIVSYLLSRAIMRPLRNLSFYLERMSQAVSDGRALPELPSTFTISSKGDDFNRLAVTVRSLSEKMQSSFAVSQASAAQMAHELKTPLTVIQNQLEKTRMQFPNNTEVNQAIESGLEELLHLNEVISGFLDWASLKSGPGDEVFAINVSELVRPLVKQLNQIHNSRLQLEMSHPLVVFAREDLVLQLVRNLLENALKYSKESVMIEILKDAITIEDSGPGFPEPVLSRLGQPFNCGPRVPGVRSTGLGLAWVKTLCDRNSWTLNITRVEHKTRVRIGIPEENRV